MFIRSERLFLRPGWPEDRTDLLARGDHWAAAGKLICIPDTALGQSAPTRNERYPMFLVTLPTGDGSRLVGCVGLVGADRGAELVYWIAPEHWGQGYASEAARALLRLARTLGHRQIAAMQFQDNAASGRVLEKIGFRPTDETCRRLCPARGTLATALVHRRDLGEPSDCDGRNGNEDDDTPVKNAA